MSKCRLYLLDNSDGTYFCYSFIYDTIYQPKDDRDFQDTSMNVELIERVSAFFKPHFGDDVEIIRETVSLSYVNITIKLRNTPENEALFTVLTSDGIDI